MSDNELDPQLAALFTDAYHELPSEAYTDRVMARIDKGRSRAMLIGAACSVLLALVAVPAHDLVLHAAEILLLPVIEMKGSLLAELLAPLNTVGGILSVLIVLMRFTHRKLFL